MKSYSKFVSLVIFTMVTMSCNGNSNSFESVDNKQFETIIATKGNQLVDVRTPEEYAMGYIPGAVCMDFRNPNFDNMITQLDKNLPVAIYCRSGRRSKIAASKMSAIGLKVYELNNGIIMWNGQIVR